MAKVDSSNGKHALGGSKDTDLEGIDSSKYDVFTDVEKLRSAETAYPKYDWFASFTIKKKNEAEKPVPEYTVTFDRPDSGNLYYYLNGTAHQVPYSDADNKGNKKRVKAKLTVDDPPIGMG